MIAGKSIYRSGMAPSLMLLLLLITASCKEKAATTAAGSSQPAAGSSASPARTARPLPLGRPGAKVVPAANARLSIQPAKLDLVGSKLNEVTIDDQGVVAFSGKPRLKLSSDGTMTTVDGKPVARLAEDGTLELAREIPDRPSIEIDERGTVTRDGETLFRIDEDGSVWRRLPDGTMDNDGLAVMDGPPESRRTLAMLVAVMSISSPKPPPPSSSVTPE